MCNWFVERHEFDQECGVSEVIVEAGQTTCWHHTAGITQLAGIKLLASHSWHVHVSPVRCLCLVTGTGTVFAFILYIIIVCLPII